MPRITTIVSLISTGALCLTAALGSLTAAEPAVATGALVKFNDLVAKYKDATPESLLKQAAAERHYVEQLSFNPKKCGHLDLIRRQLNLTANDLATFAKQGFVSLPQLPASNFGEAYFGIYSKDLPVLITADSLLHVVHRSFDNTLKEIEERMLAPTIARILTAAHEELGRRGVAAGDPWAENYRDVDLSLTVARNLLAGDRAAANGELPAVPSRMNQDREAREILQLIAAGRLQNHPDLGQTTAIFGGKRPIDYSQFKPRGHYTKSRELQNYFRAMMWLGRADCGWIVAPVDPYSGIESDSHRELRDAALLTDLLTATKQLKPLEAIDRIIEVLVGESDNLRPMQLRKLLDDSKIATLADLDDPRREAEFRKAVADCLFAQQQIASQVIYGSKVHGEQMRLPALFQVFGQRFAVDSFVLANVVYDTVQITDAKGYIRAMPRGFDVLAALGNPEAAGLLDGELHRWNYAPQLLAARDFTAAYMTSPTGQRSVYDLWLAALCTLHADMSGQKNFPEVMRTRAWGRKQLNAQLASWAEMRHDAGILFVKQSYTRNEECSYPAAYIEPYPALYSRLANMAQRIATVLAQAETGLQQPDDNADGAQPLWREAERPRRFWNSLALTMEKLERLARKELNAEPFTAEEEDFLKRTINVQGGGNDKCGALQFNGPKFAVARRPAQFLARLVGYPSPTVATASGAMRSDRSQSTRRPIQLCLAELPGRERTYTGWYCDLLYPQPEGIDEFVPTVADVHTNPVDRPFSEHGPQVLEVGVGRADLIVVAIDNGKDRMAFVGPTYTYYEFAQPVNDRMTDEQFKARLERGEDPGQPQPRHAPARSRVSRQPAND